MCHECGVNQRCLFLKISLAYQCFVTLFIWPVTRDVFLVVYIILFHEMLARPVSFVLSEWNNLSEPLPNSVTQSISQLQPYLDHKNLRIVSRRFYQ
jgi:hypothetical protein